MSINITPEREQTIRYEFAKCHIKSFQDSMRNTSLTVENRRYLQTIIDLCEYGQDLLDLLDNAREQLRCAERDARLYLSHCECARVELKHKAEIEKDRLERRKMR